MIFGKVQNSFAAELKGKAIYSCLRPSCGAQVVAEAQDVSPDEDDDDEYSESEARTEPQRLSFLHSQDGWNDDVQRPRLLGSLRNTCGCYDRPIPPGKVDGQSLNVGSTGHRKWQAHWHPGQDTTFDSANPAHFGIPRAAKSGL